MRIKTKIDYKDYLSWNIQIILRRPIMLVFPIAITIILINNVDLILSFDVFSLTYVAVVLMIIIWTPLQTRRKIKNDFESNKSIQEEIIYQFSKEKIEVIGETFHSDVSWTTVFKINESKDWFMIYHSNNAVNLIPKKNFTQQQKQDLRILITSHNIKSKLRKD